MKKSVIAILVALVMCAGLTGCGTSAVKKIISEQALYCKGSTETSVYTITFNDGNAELKESYVSNEGLKEGITDSAPYSINKDAITISWNEIDEMTIPYAKEDGKIVFAGGLYKSESDIEEAIQGTWENNILTGGYDMPTVQVKVTITFNEGEVDYSDSSYMLGYTMNNGTNANTYDYRVDDGYIFIDKGLGGTRVFFTIKRTGVGDGAVCLYSPYGQEYVKK